MSNKFPGYALFNSYKYFFELERNTVFPADIPSIREFIDQVSTIVPDASTDYRHVKDFLWSKCRKSEATYNAFRSETERFLLWSWSVKQKSIAEMKKRDIEEYIEFVIKPPKDWIGTEVSKRFYLKSGLKHINPIWRPFVATISKAERKEIEEQNKINGSVRAIKPEKSNYKLSQKSIREVFSNLSVLYTHLVEEDYAYGNMIQAVKKASPHLIVDVSNEGVKRLSARQWEYVLNSTKSKANSDPLWERHLFVIACLKSLYLRVSELSYRTNWAPKMGDFWLDADGCWWFRAFGKGNKKRKVSVPNDFLMYLSRYRESRNLPSLPSVNESTPLLQPLRKHVPGLQVRAIRNIAQEAFDLAGENLKRDGFTEDAKTLKATSTHWLRHTGASMDVDDRPLKDLSADLGHGKISTTDQAYVHSDDQERAASGALRKV